MEQTILTDAQRSVLSQVAAEPLLQAFYLSGGTALSAYYLFHRISDDLDFFTEGEVDQTFLLFFIATLKEHLGAAEARQERLFDRNLFFLKLPYIDEPLKLEFTKYPFPLLSSPEVHEGLRVDSVRDITANKLMTMLERFDPKDFVDLYFLLQDRDLHDVCKDVEKKFGIKVGGLFLGSELAKVRRIEALPKMLKPLSVEELKAYFTDLARQLDKTILD